MSVECGRPAGRRPVPRQEREGRTSRISYRGPSDGPGSGRGMDGKARDQGPYHTSNPSPTAGCGCTIKRTFPLSQRQEGPRPQPPSWVAQGPSKRRCGRPVRPSPRDWARALTARSARDYAFQRIACTSIEVQTLQPQGIAGTEKPARGIDVPGKKVYN